MDAITDQLSFLHRLPALAEEARRSGSLLHRPVLVSITAAVDAPASPLPLPEDDCFFWDQPSRGISLVAAGEATRLSADGPNRFETVRGGLVALARDAIVEGMDASPVPFAVAGFGFEAARVRGDRWTTFLPALAVVPRLLLVRRGGHASLTVNLLVFAATDPSLAVECLIADAARLLDPRAAAVCASASPAGLHSNEDDRGAWIESVRALTDRIAAGEAEKVVLARKVDIAAERPFQVDAALARLRQRYPDCTIFAVRHGEVCFLGATPELLVALDGPRVRTDCLAGSARRGVTAAEDDALGAALLADEKELREHSLVVRGLKQALEPLGRDLHLPATPGLRRTANVQHLHTPIEATVDAGRHVLDFVERLHPTPATAGLPTDRALSLIRENESFNRGWYAGPLGWLDAAGNGEFAVALRSALVRGCDASLFAGCGIVAGSDPEREYDESRVKLQAMLWALGAS